jgi:hypothetical protein
LAPASLSVIVVHYFERFEGPTMSDNFIENGPLPPYTGFLFEWSRPDLNSDGGKRSVELIVVAQTTEDAMGLAGNLVGDPSGLKLIDSGPDALGLAKKQGIADGQASFLADRKPRIL